MNLVTLAESLNMGYTKSTCEERITFEAGREYVMSRDQYYRLMQDPKNSQLVFKNSQLECRIENFNVNARKPGSQRLLLYNGSGGYGDQILTWPFAKILAMRGYEVHVMCDPGNTLCWWHFPWIRSLQPLPMQYEQFKLFDYHCMMETVTNTDEHQDQDHPLDTMLRKVGIDPYTVDAKQKVIRPNFTYLEMQSVEKFAGKRIGMYQLSASNQTRSLPAGDSAFMLSKIADAYPDIHWLALHDKYNLDSYREAISCKKCGGKGKLDAPVNTNVSASSSSGTHSTGTLAVSPVKEDLAQICPKCKGSGAIRPNIQSYSSPDLRELWALTTKAAVVVAPDSMMVHVAGCMDVPCVGLWGLTAPVNRIKYYLNHAPIWKREACPFAPCYTYGGCFPRYCPPRANRTVCECLGAIAPSDVLDALKQIIPPSAK